MTILGAGPLMRRRFTAGAFVNGRWTGDTVAETSLTASVQPLNGRDRMSLPEGQRTSEGYKLYIRGADAVRTANQHATPAVKADQVVIGGAFYDVIHVDDAHPLLTHTRAYVLRVTE